MSAVSKFEDIEAWQRGRGLVREVYRATASGSFSRDFALRDQIRRAALGIVSNIAEGFNRGGSTEFRRYLLIAKGSAAEVQTQLYVALDVGYLQQGEFDRIYGISQEVANLIGGFFRSLR